MWTVENVNKNIIKNKSNLEFENNFFSFVINEKPEAYARERKGRGKHFYNPKGDIIDRYRKIMKGQLTDEQVDQIKGIYALARKRVSRCLCRVILRLLHPNSQR